MKKAILLVTAVLLFPVNIASADTFGTGANQFEIDFVTISGDNGDLGSWPAGSHYAFSGVNHGDYRVGTYEITNDQWNKFKNEYGTVTGSPSSAYDSDPYFTGTNVPTNNVSWCEAVQFVNWLNTSTGHQAAYKFTGEKGTSGYTLSVWESGDMGYNPSNPYRNSKAIYFLPTEDEWVKAAYWNGTSLQTYATKPGDFLHQGDGTSGTGWNYYSKGYALDTESPWDVGSGSEELNGTFDMMGNIWEFTESPYSGNFTPDSDHRSRGGSYYFSYVGTSGLSSTYRSFNTIDGESINFGFRVASVPEPATVSLLAVGGLVLLRKRKSTGDWRLRTKDCLLFGEGR